MKGNKGITLIALVITIIVLLILAAVSIAMLTGENSILNRASESAANNALGTAKDKCALIASSTLTEYYKTVYVGNTATEYKSETLDTNVKNAITTAAVDVEDVTAAWTDKKVKLTYTKDGSYVEGDLSDGKITWKTIVNNKGK